MDSLEMFAGQLSNLRIRLHFAGKHDYDPAPFKRLDDDIGNLRSRVAHIVNLYSKITPLNGMRQLFGGDRYGDMLYRSWNGYDGVGGMKDMIRAVEESLTVCECALGQGSHGMNDGNDSYTKRLVDVIARTNYICGVLDGTGRTNGYVTSGLPEKSESAI